MFRLTIQRCMHDSKIPNITRARKIPIIYSSFDSPRKMDYHKPNKQEPPKWRRVWPKYRVHSQQYREYKATYGDGSTFTERSLERMRHQFDVERELWTKDSPHPHEHAEAEEEDVVWGDIDHDYVHLEGEEAPVNAKPKWPSSTGN